MNHMVHWNRAVR